MEKLPTEKFLFDFWHDGMPAEIYDTNHVFDDNTYPGLVDIVDSLANAIASGREVGANRENVVRQKWGVIERGRKTLEIYVGLCVHFMTAPRIDWFTMRVVHEKQPQRGWRESLDIMRRHSLSMQRAVAPAEVARTWTAGTGHVPVEYDLRVYGLTFAAENAAELVARSEGEIAHFRGQFGSFDGVEKCTLQDMTQRMLALIRIELYLDALLLVVRDRETKDEIISSVAEVYNECGAKEYLERRIAERPPETFPSLVPDAHRVGLHLYREDLRPLLSTLFGILNSVMRNSAAEADSLDWLPTYMMLGDITELLYRLGEEMMTCEDHPGVCATGMVWRNAAYLLRDAMPLEPSTVKYVPVPYDESRIQVLLSLQMERMEVRAGQT